MLKFSALLSLVFTHLACASNWPQTNSTMTKDPQIEKEIQKILARMSLEQKVAQMIQAEIKHIKPEDLAQFPLGSILNGGGSFPYNNKDSNVSDWVKLADAFYNASIKAGSGIPLIWGTDAVHGHNNFIGATIFPHNIGLGAANNDVLIEKITSATAKEVLATGLDWIFAPTVAVVRNDRWGRAYEGYSEDPEIVKKYAAAAVKGLQGINLGEDHLIATVKHFIGDGGTKDGVDQGDNIASEKELIRLHAQGYISALNAGAQTVMASFNSWQGEKVHGHKYLLTDVLKNKMKFDGFVIGDWNGHGQVKGCKNDSCPKAINAGVDMLMAPEDWKQLFYNTVGQVKSGEISIDRINDAVTRILRVKLRYGIFNLGVPSSRKHAGNNKLIGAAAHREIARQAVRESLVLLKNKNEILPLNRNKKILVTGPGANNIGKQSGGWSVTWQGTGTTNADFPGGETIFHAIKKVAPNAFLSDDLNTSADLAIFVFGEEPYAEGQGDIPHLYYGERFARDLKTLKTLKARNIPVISIFITGRPLWINPELNQSDAFVVAWLPGTEVSGIADVIFKNENENINYDFKGKLSFSWPNHANQVELNRFDKKKALFSYGYGLTYNDIDSLSDNLSEIPFPGSDPSVKDKINIFVGRPIDPFKVYAGNNSELFNAGVGKTSDGSLRAIAIDKDVQEDARKIYIYSPSKYIFKANTPLNLKQFRQGIISFQLRKESDQLENFKMAVDQIELTLSSQLSSVQTGQWVDLNVSIHCLESRGLDLDNITHIFGISADKGILSLANIKILKEYPGNGICD